MKRNRLLAIPLLIIGALCFTSCDLFSTTKDNDYQKKNDNANVVEITSSYTDVKNKVYYSCFGVRTRTSVDNNYKIGSCVCIKQDDDYSYLITNRHVVEDSDESKVSSSVSIYFGDGYYKDGSVLFSTTYNQRASNEADDLALIRIETPKSYTINACELNDKVVTKGVSVVSVGCPISLTNYNTITAGVISKMFSSQNIIMHTSTINPGNSGGGLFTLEGKLLGINVSRTEMTKSGSLVEDAYYAIDLDHVRSFLSKNNFSL